MDIYTFLSLGCVVNNSSGEIFVFVTNKRNDFPILIKYGAVGTLLKNQVFADLRDILMTDMVLGDDEILVVVGAHESDGSSYIIRINQDLGIQ